MNERRGFDKRVAQALETMSPGTVGGRLRNAMRQVEIVEAETATNPIPISGGGSEGGRIEAVHPKVWWGEGWFSDPLVFTIPTASRVKLSYRMIATAREVRGSILGYDGSDTFEFAASFGRWDSALDEGAPYLVPYFQTIEDMPAGEWEIWAEGTLLSGGTPTDQGATLDAIIGQPMTTQVLWSGVIV